MKTPNVFAVASASAARALIALALGAACTVTYADTYQYDERGDLETLTTPRGVRTYQYDEVQRLELEQGYTGNREHVYDRNGSRATDGATAPGSPTAATYVDDSNRIATINGAAISIDDAGQITNDGVNTYTWDDAGRLKTVSRAGQLRATYHYDHKHRRTRKVTTAAAPQGVQTIRYHYDDRDRLMAETTGAGVPLRSYVRADDTLLAIAKHIPQGGGTYEIRMLYLELDHLGTPRQARIDGGAIVWRWESDGYGTSAANEDPDGNGQPTTVNLRFPGQYYDEESGLHYNWHRYYVPRLGRYLSSDPIGIEGGSSTYGYAGGNPISFIDPTGLERWDFDGHGDTSACTYYDQKAKENPSCSYYKEAATICRGQKKSVNRLTAVAIGTAYATSHSFSDSQSLVMNKIRNNLTKRDAEARAAGSDNCGCPRGDDIDAYHNDVFRDAGLSPFFYGGNLAPQNTGGNPVPYDPRGFNPVDDVFNWRR